MGRLPLGSVAMELFSSNFRDVASCLLKLLDSRRWVWGWLGSPSMRILDWPSCSYGAHKLLLCESCQCQCERSYIFRALSLAATHPPPLEGMRRIGPARVNFELPWPLPQRTK